MQETICAQFPPPHEDSNPNMQLDAQRWRKIHIKLNPGLPAGRTNPYIVSGNLLQQVNCREKLFLANLRSGEKFAAVQPLGLVTVAENAIMPNFHKAFRKNVH